MKIRTYVAQTLIGAVVVLMICPGLGLAQTQPATSVVGYPGAGVLQVGDLWDSFLPQAFGPYYGEGGTATAEGIRTFCRFGNFDRAWSTPGSHWPSAFHWTMYWARYMNVAVFDPDPNFNPTGKGEAAPVTGQYAQVTFKNTLPGASDANRLYSIEPYYVDGDRRQHAVYEAGWPTNVGLDVKLRAHGFSGPNWGHFNDFVILEIEFRNTGVRDLDLDGNPDVLLTPADIRALSIWMGGEIFMSIRSSPGGGRNFNSISGKFTRMGGWINDPDPDGFPWAFSTYYPGAKTQVPGPGESDFGFNAPTLATYTDTWNGWVWIDVKQGGLPADRSRSTSPQPPKNTIFNTHAVGVGPERGRYVSGGSGGGLASASTINNPRRIFTVSSGVWYRNGGASRSVSDLDESPDPNFFDSGTTGDITSFVPKAVPGIPQGDQKSSNSFEAQPFEDGSDSPTGYGRWTQGYNFAHDFNGDLFSGIGPIAIANGESVTFVLAMVGGFRLEGIQRAVMAARYTYENDFQIPAPPPVPDVKVSNTLQKSVLIEWNNVADTECDGYKIWKASSFKKKKWLEEGLRLADRFQEQMDPNADRNQFKKPVNPKFDAFKEIADNSLQGEYQPDTWGTWELVADLGKTGLPPATTPGYNYSYDDKDVVLGFTYFYYVSAYRNGTFQGPGGQTTTRIETHYLNRNGASGLWQKTFPFGTTNANFPKDAAGLKAIGAQQVVYSALAGQGDVSNAGVRPNPYKRAALHDNFEQVYDHKLLFYNLPPECTITILDVSGQIIDQFDFTSADANRGSIFWDMFSKDGIEVASGLYVYVVESPTGGQKVGYFSILR